MTNPTGAAPLTPEQFLKQTLERLMPNPPQFEWVGACEYSRPIPPDNALPQPPADGEVVK